MKVLVSDKLAKEGVAALQQNPNVTVDVITDLTPEQLKEKIKEYDALVVRSATKVTAEIIEAADKLKAIGRAGVGIDNIDVKAATKKGIIVLNAPAGNTISTAEHTMAMLMSLSRKTPIACASLKSGKWEKSKFVGVELYNKTIGIIGLGRIGSQVAKRCLAFGMKVMGYDPFMKKENAEKMGITLAEIKEIFAEADFLTFHTPLSEQTKYLVNKDTLALMKPGVRILNCARGGIIKEEDLLAAIKEGKVAGAALDVFEKEPAVGNPLLELDEVIATPHLGASTKEAQVNVAVDVAKQILIALTGGPVATAVNIPAVSPDLLAALKPYLELGEKLGRLQGQFIDGRIEEVEITYSGEVTNQDIAPLTTVILKGIFDEILTEQVNLVNAPFIAKERGINVKEAKSNENKDFTNLINVTLKTDKGSCAVAGTVFGTHNVRIVKINDYHIDLLPAPYLLFTQHTDKPGMVAHVSNVLAQNEVNIARMQVGRQDAGGEAIMLLEIDHVLAPEALEQIKAKDGVAAAKIITL
ncbi:MAG: phosphoglycerate dehydrogenase [bacterium]